MRQQVDEDVANWIEYATWLDLVNEQFLDNYLNIPGYAAKIEKVLSSKKARQLFERRWVCQVPPPQRHKTLTSADTDFKCLRPCLPTQRWTWSR